MAYLGNAPARSFISFERQVFTIVNSQTAYTLSHSVTNENDIRLVINNIVQEPGSGKAYTASGTTLTLSAALTNGTDEMYCVFLGRATATNKPGAGSVGTTELAADAVTGAKIADDAISDEHLDPTAITGQAAETSVATDDLILLSDTSDSGALKKMTRANFVSGIGGIEEIDMWRLNNNFSGSGGSSYALINNYWERADTDGFVKKGTGLSESSGIFTFPSTGYYFITWNFETVQNNDAYVRIKMMFGGSSGNNSAVNQDASGANGSGYASVTSSVIINCTDVADKFTFYNSTSNGSIDGDSGSNRSGFTCFKLG
jgi:hypothetical protein